MFMKRYILTYLSQWLSNVGRKPLILRGARQVGKTWLVRHLAEIENKQLIELNFEKDSRLKSFFQTNDPQQIIQNISHYLGIEIKLEQSLLFLDEIQVVPELLAKLRWFAEDMPQLPVVAAGSLLDFVLEEHSFSMPVGRVSYAHVEPFSFEEFLLAIKKDGLVNFLEQYTMNQVIPDIIHEELMRYLREYTFVGGLPNAVKSWVQTQMLTSVHEVQYELINTYRDDFSKYRKRLPPERLEDVWNAAPKMLGKQWKYSQVNPDVQSTSLKQALHLLTLARLCHKISACSADGLPLAAGIHEKTFKTVFLDVGLVSTALGLSLNKSWNIQTFSLMNEGGLAEQLVGQGLRTTFPFYMEPILFYWSREKKGAIAEVDYLIQHGSQIIPIEVKAGKTGQMRSLHVLMGLRQWPLAVRFNADYPSLTPVAIKTALEVEAKYTLLSLPFYLVGQLPRLLDL